MKKLTQSVSPFLMMILPVVLFIGLSLTLKDNVANQQENLSTNTISSKTTTQLVKVSEQSIIKFLLK